MKSFTEGYKTAAGEVEKLLARSKVADTMQSETMLIFEALCMNIFEQRKKNDPPVRVQGSNKGGYVSIRISFNGKRYDPEGGSAAGFSLESKILKAYAEKIDYSYRAGYNKIVITVRNSYFRSLLPCAVGVLLAIAAYLPLQALTGEAERQYLLTELISPLEELFGNAMLMVGAPVTFLSLLKNLTDTYIISDLHSSVRIMQKRVFVSSGISVLLAIATSRMVALLASGREIPLFDDMTMQMGFSLRTFITELIPSDIFTPLQTLSPFPIIIVAAMVTYAFCSVGKYFDNLKGAVDAGFALFSRMLSIVMIPLPFFIFAAIADVLLRYGFEAFKYLAELILLVIMSAAVLLAFYVIRLRRCGIKVMPFLKKMGPLLMENFKIGSAIDAVPYNIRYCARVYNMDRGELDKNLPVLAQINLDGNCYFITLVALILVFMSNPNATVIDVLGIATLVFFLSLGAPNQPGSFLIAMLIILHYVEHIELIPIAIFCEVFFGGILNIMNVQGDIITTAEMGSVRDRFLLKENKRKTG
ncbi:MAG: dicarboxylate/amino acid:cation symporter [Stomatobaculum sp.]|nr:dicarboxylate/amino acid:cation symporter [Stomatobaculum sp.]